MSRSTVYGLWPNTTKRVELVEFHNSWGMAPVIWNAMAQRYLGTPPHGFMFRVEELWPMHERADLPLYHRALLRMTFDTRYIADADRSRAAGDIHHWLLDFRPLIDIAAVNHWPTLAELLRADRDDPPPAIGIWHTSVSDNPWDGPYDPNTEERGPFNWSQAASVYADL